jgi:dTDP-4-amino-4,6-dideoxygalactose transaminase
MASLAYKIVQDFEQTIAEYAGSKYAVAVESGSAAIFLSCLYKKVKKVVIPTHTYPSVPCSIINAGGQVEFTEAKWEGVYELFPYEIIDGALRFKRGMYKGGLHCLSFHSKKLLPIGRGGMILTDDEVAYEWFKKARFDGRDEKPLSEDSISIIGWNMYMTPEQAARGLQLFDMVKHKDLEDLKVESQGYVDLNKLGIYK